MALDAAIVWEFRTTGSNDNGGGFKTGASGTDYTLQDAAQLTLTDLAMTTGGTTLTSATGGFTAAMIGNVIYIKSGTHFVAGWYEITARADTNTVTIDRDATDGTNGTDGTGSVGGARALPTDAFFEALTAGNKVYLKAGTYTLTENIDVANDGTAELPIEVEGYNSSRGDVPIGDNRPLIAASSYTFIFDNYWTFKHLRITTTEEKGFQCDQYCLRKNCKAENSSGTAWRNGFSVGDDSNFIDDCEAISTNGYAINTNYKSFATITYCYVHDSEIGIGYLGLAFYIYSNIIDTNTWGIRNWSGVDIAIINNTIYNCGTGILNFCGFFSIIKNNIIDTCTTGINWGATEYKCNYCDYNNWHGNTTDVSNITKGANETAYDPEFIDAAGGDFSLDTTSDCIGAGFGIRLGVGA